MIFDIPMWSGYCRLGCAVRNYKVSYLFNFYVYITFRLGNVWLKEDQRVIAKGKTIYRDIIIYIYII